MWASSTAAEEELGKEGDEETAALAHAGEDWPAREMKRVDAEPDVKAECFASVRGVRAAAGVEARRWCPCCPPGGTPLWTVPRFMLEGSEGSESPWCCSDEGGWH